MKLRVKNFSYRLIKMFPANLLIVVLISFVMTSLPNHIRMLLSLDRDNLWGIILAIFVHFSWAHFITNMIFLLLLGWMLPTLTDRVSPLMAFLAFAILDNIAVLGVIIRAHSDIHVMGASSGISGLLGLDFVLDAYYVIKYLELKYLHDEDINYGCIYLKMLVIIMIMMAFLDTYSLILEPYSFLVHLVGVMLGALYGISLLIPHKYYQYISKLMELKH